MNKKHMHAEVIKAWADGAEIEGRQEGTRNWVERKTPGWNEDWEYRIKPAAPVVETKMTDREIDSAWLKSTMGLKKAIESRRDFLNAGLAKAIADGQVVPVDQKNYVDRLAFLSDTPGMIEAARAKRDMAVARAVKSAVIEAWGQATGQNEYMGMEGVNLAAIIAGVKP